jgi:hypothetical protein
MPATTGYPTVEVMTTQGHPSGGLATPRRKIDIRLIGAVAGIVGPLLFSAGFIVQGLFRRDDYDPIAETVSALEAGPNGWIQQLNFFVFGILMMIFGVGLGAGLRGGRQRTGSVMVIWWGIGLLMAGLFPLRENVDRQTYDPTGMQALSQCRLQLRCIHGRPYSKDSCLLCGFRASLCWRPDGCT